MPILIRALSEIYAAAVHEFVIELQTGRPLNACTHSDLLCN